jgi:hypothetical protein
MIKLKFHFLLLPIVVYTREYLLICFPKFELSQFISCGHEEYPLKLAHKLPIGRQQVTQEVKGTYF